MPAGTTPSTAAYGLPFESPATRLRRLGEAVEVIRLLWTEEVADYQGEFFTLDRGPVPPQAGAGPAAHLDRCVGRSVGAPQAGRLADGWNIAFVSPEDFARKRAIVMEHAPAPTGWSPG